MNDDLKTTPEEELKVLERLQSIQPSQELHTRTLKAMRSARSSSSQSRYQQPWWKKRASIPLPALALNLIAFIGLIIFSFKPDAPDVATTRPSAFVEGNLQTEAKHQPVAFPSKPHTVTYEVAYYVPTVGIISNQKTTIVQEHKP